MKRLGKYKKITDQNFYSLGELLIVDIRKYGGTAAFSDEKSREFFGDDEDVLTGIQSVLLPEDKDILYTLQQMKAEVHRYLFLNSVPHELPSFYYIYLVDKEAIEAYLERAKERYKELAQMFADRWKDIESRYAAAKPKLYRPEKYPSKANLLTRFVFQWKWKKIMPSDDGSEDLKKEIENMKRYVILTLKKTIADRMDALRKGCEGGKLSSATLDSINNQIFDRYDRLFQGFVDPSEMRAAIEDLKEYLDGTDADMLRADEDFRAMIADKAKAVAKTVKKVKEPKGDRGLIF